MGREAVSAYDRVILVGPEQALQEALMTTVQAPALDAPVVRAPARNAATRKAPVAKVPAKKLAAKKVAAKTTAAKKAPASKAAAKKTARSVKDDAPCRQDNHSPWPRSPKRCLTAN
jgi:hypothetical protein